MSHRGHFHSASLTCAGGSYLIISHLLFPKRAQLSERWGWESAVRAPSIASFHPPAGGAQTAALCLLSVLAERRWLQLRETFDPNLPNTRAEPSLASDCESEPFGFIQKCGKCIKERLDLESVRAGKSQNVD